MTAAPGDSAAPDEIEPNRTLKDPAAPFPAVDRSAKDDPFDAGVPGRARCGPFPAARAWRRRRREDAHARSRRWKARRTEAGLLRLGEMSEDDAQPLHRGSGGSTYMKESARNTGSP